MQSERVGDLWAAAMELHEALSQIADIRRRMACGETYRGFRSVTVGVSGVLAMLAAAAQPHWAPSPESQLDRYLGLWVAVAAVNLATAGIEMFAGYRAAEPGLARQAGLAAAEQFLPCVAVGALLTLCISRTAPEVAWMLPGLWALTFGLGVFAAQRSLPRPGLCVGAYYVLCGCGCLIWGQGDRALSPWSMAITFGGGQLLAAAVLYRTLERADATQD